LRTIAPIVCLALLVAGCSKAPAEPNGTAQAAPAAPASTPTTQTAGTAAPGVPEQGPAAQPGAPTAEPAKPVPATLPAVIARVNGEAIASSELQEAIASLEGQAGRPLPPTERDQVFRAVLNQLVTGHVLLQESRSRNVVVADADIDSRVGQLRQRFPSEDEFKKALSSRGLTPEKMKDELRKQIAIERMIEAEVTPQVKVTDQDVKAFYDGNPDQFKQPESFRASHILVMVPQDASPQQKAEAKAKIEDVQKQLEGGGDFAELAKKYSQDGSASQGGDLNYFPRGQMVEPFQKAVDALDIGAVSGIVETQFGYHIVKLTDKKAGRTVPLPEVNKKIADYLVMRQKQEKASAFVESLKAKSRIDILI
jgi:peptidyl-prolyl cis-trans isomerase C